MPNAPSASPDGCSVWPPMVAGRRVPDCAVSIDGVPVGAVTSGNFSPTLGQGIAFAFLPPDTAQGQQVVVDVRGKDLPGHVVATPFVG